MPRSSGRIRPRRRDSSSSSRAVTACRSRGWTPTVPGAEFEQHIAALGGRLLRPDRKNEHPRFGTLGGIRQWIESTFDTLKDQLSLERHGGRTLSGLVSRIARRLLALTAAILHNWHTNNPGRRLTAYDH